MLVETRHDSQTVPYTIDIWSGPWRRCVAFYDEVVCIAVDIFIVSLCTFPAASFAFELPNCQEPFFFAFSTIVKCMSSFSWRFVGVSLVSIQLKYSVNMTGLDELQTVSTMAGSDSVVVLAWAAPCVEHELCQQVFVGVRHEGQACAELLWRLRYIYVNTQTMDTKITITFALYLMKHKQFLGWVPFYKCAGFIKCMTKTEAFLISPHLPISLFGSAYRSRVFMY